MKWILKFLIIFHIACQYINVVFGMHNPMMRIRCDLGEHLTCKFSFIYCWMYQCVCLPQHVYIGLGYGCLYEKFA
ncbi:uncharacterized protein LOC123037411 [Drosophila rhopaloa]|uniref:Uncharacterized protein n=1 Tax=Drosophila rhopaloa TaxID=1041015 RepID=A0ABM5J4M9_DRORH|nr:uncharacterized protein LOC123037411 [Drosophila rhopaloa]